MGKITRHQHISHAATPTRAEKANIPNSLKNQKEAINKFVVLGRGQGLLGAGKPPAFSNTPPKTGSKRVEQSVTGTLIPAKAAKRK